MIQKALLISLSLFIGLCLKAQSLRGFVMDSSSHKRLSEASVYFPLLKLGSITDTNGYYKISPLPSGIYEVVVTMVGYGSITRRILIDRDMALDFVVTSSSVSLNEVTVTALGNTMNILHAPEPVSVVTHDMFLQQASTNVIDAIARQPGITAITTGPGVSKPEINGLGYNRVLTIMDGERQEDFQWGDEHGILIDPNAVYNAEIIRGPASLQYGANAMAGVVSLRSQPLPENGIVRSSVQSEYQTNNGLFCNSIDINGNKKGFVWDIRASYETAHSYWDPHDGYVWGTAFIQDNLRAVLGLNRKWGYTHLTISTLHRQIEIPDGNRDSATGRFEFDVPLNAQYANGGKYVLGSGQIFPTRSNFLSYDPNISSYQVLSHEAVWWQNSINVGRGRMGADIGYTRSVRHEIDTGNVAQENMFVHDIPYSIKYQLEVASSHLKLTTGFNGVYEFMNNGAEPISPYVGDFEIPDYHIFDIGGYAILGREFKKLTLSGGLRYDVRRITGNPMYLTNYNLSDQHEVPSATLGAYTQFSPASQTYSGFSGSIGVTYQLPAHNYIKLNVAKSYRAPAINELTSNEINPGAFAYELGNIHLKSEEGYQMDMAIGNIGKDINFEADGFYNLIDNFIFSDRLGNGRGGDSLLLGKPVYQYTANTAITTGVAAYLNIHPVSVGWLEIDNGFTYIYSLFPGQSDSTHHIPWTPAPRLISKVRFKLSDRSHSMIKGTFFDFGLAKYWAQKDIYGALYTELPSYSYMIYNAGIGTNFINRRTQTVLCTLLINCTNLMNISYVDHTARTQYFWAYNGVNDPTNFGRTPAVVTKQSEGIYNMGRNIGIKLIFPIGLAANKN
jgi:iron complex outermembrane recepter protein